MEVFILTWETLIDMELFDFGSRHESDLHCKKPRYQLFPQVNNSDMTHVQDWLGYWQDGQKSHIWTGVSSPIMILFDCFELQKWRDTFVGGQCHRDP